VVSESDSLLVSRELSLDCLICFVFQVDVNDVHYHTFPADVVPIQTSDSLCIWFEEAPDQLYLNQVEMHLQPRV